MTYADRAEQAQQEQLDWLHEIHQQSRAQTELLRTIARHTGLIYGLTVAALVCLGIYVLAVLFG